MVIKKNFFLLYIKTVAANIYNLKKSNINIILDKTIYKANNEIFKLIKDNRILKILNENLDNSNQLNNNKFKSFKFLEK